MQIFNIHKQAEFTKKKVNPIVYRIERLWTKGQATFIFAQYKRGLEAISLTVLVWGQGWLVSLTPPNNPLVEVYAVSECPLV